VHEFQPGGGARDRTDALLEEVLDRLDVVVGRRLDGLDALGVGERKARGEAEVAASKGPNSGTPGSAARRCSQRTSTSTRKRIRPNSLKIGRRLAVLAP